MSVARIDRRLGPSGSQATRRARCLLLRLEELERRRLLNYTVNDGGDAPLDPSKGRAQTSSGSITLRSAIQQIDMDGSGEIDFAVSTVNCTNLPFIDVPATVNGGTVGNVTINGCGLTFTAGNSVAEYLVINGGSDNGIYMNGANNKVLGNQIMGNAAWGVILDQAPSSTVGGTTASDRNVISGNQEGGVAIDGGSSTGDVVEGNYIGTDVTGNVAQGNAYGGVYVGSGSLFTDNPPGSASGATIGGTAAGAGNLISGNDTALTGNGGIVIYGTGASDNLIEGNQIGVNAAGTAALPNLGIGIDIFGGATSNTVGGSTTAAANVVSGNQGNGENGINITGPGTSGNVIEGNHVGVDAAGTIAIANSGSGIVITSSSDNTIGGTTSAAGNVISGNQGIGVFLYGSGTNSNLLTGNRIGTDVSGTIALGNVSAGIGVADDAVNNTIGGTASGAGNLISGNKSQGVIVSDAGTTGNVVAGNLIGTDATGTVAMGNTGQGVLVGNGATSNTIGGTTPGARNVISGNNGDGIDINNAGTSQNVVVGNFVGTDITGSVALGNTGVGLSISDSASTNTIGGTTSSAANVFSGNQGDAIDIDGSGASANVVAGNFIGTDATGMNAIPNSGDGVRIEDGASNDTIGGTANGAANTIAYNGGNGVTIGQDASDVSTGDTIECNSIFGNQAIGIDLGDDGVTLINSQAGSSGPNDWQNFPLLQPALGNGAILATLRSAPGTYRIEFFANPTASSSGVNQGQTYIGFADLTISQTNSTGSVTFTPSPPLVQGSIVTATATSPDGDTSEFDQTYSIAVVVPGLFRPPIPSWAGMMVNALKSEGYNNAFAFDWPSILPIPGLVKTWASKLEARILGAIKSADLSQMDIDLHVITYSRGVGLVNLTLKALATDGPNLLTNGAIDDTMLDPYPASRASIGSWSVNKASVKGIAFATAVTTFDLLALDPNVSVPTNVTSAEVYFQHTLTSAVPSLTNPNPPPGDPGPYLNLWGRIPNMPPGLQASITDLTGTVDHITMPTYYLMNVLMAPPAANASTSDDRDGLHLLGPQMMNDATSAQSLVSKAQAFGEDERQGKTANLSTEPANAVSTLAPRITAMAQSSVLVTSTIVTMTNVREKTNKKHRVTEVIVTVSGPVNAGKDDRTSLYCVADTARTWSLTGKNVQVVKLKSAVYSAENNTVVLTPKRAFALAKKVHLELDGLPPSILRDSDGKSVDDDDNWTAGGDAIAIVDETDVTIDAVTELRTNVRTTATKCRTDAVIDALLERNEFTSMKHIRRARGRA